MKTMSTPRALLFPLSAVLLAGSLGCGRTERLDVRTFRLENMQSYEIAPLIEPYVYHDREGAGGQLSLAEGAITVRETPDNLDRIESLIREFDTPQADVRLHFQLIEADGFTDSDPRIAAVETELRKILQFGGYRLAGEAFVSITDGSEVMQGLHTADGLFEVFGTVHRLTDGLVRLENVSLRGEQSGDGLRTTVNVRLGQTLVLGSSPKAGSTVTLLLTVRAEAVPGAGE